ncbi:hypothetical protein BDL97_13G020300 [Sphagnum fallax]|nr:hypothetical protein BDL97_13G020300 [Sphagnum fallax]
MDSLLMAAGACTFGARLCPCFVSLRLPVCSSRRLPHYELVIRCASVGGKKKNSSSSSNKRSQTSSGSGFGTKIAAKPSWDAGVLLRRSEQSYSHLFAEHSKEGEVREFVICVRQNDNKSSAVLDDWLPVAELALVSEIDASVALPAVLHVLCREVAECAAKGAMSLRNIPRNCLEYAYEPAEGFYEFVLGISQLPPQDNNECPYSVLGLPQGAPVSQVRSAYRTLAAKHHPDKHVATNVNNAELEFKRVTRAYDQIKRTGLAKDGTIASYSSLGGTARNGLSNPISINSTNLQDELPKGVQAAVRQLDSEIITRFLARSCARSGAAAVV